MIYELQRAKASAFIKDQAGKPIKFFAGAKNRLCAPYDKYGYLTGLDEEKQKYFEKALNMPNGYLNRNSSFYDEWYVEVGAAPTKLNDEEPLDALAILLLRQKDNVGATLQDAQRNGIEYILTSEDHEAKTIIDSRSYKMKAFTHLSTMTDEAMRNYLIATNRKVSGLSKETIERKVGDDAETDPKKFMEVVTNGDLDILVFVNELIQVGILYKNGSAIVDKASGETIAYRVEDVINKFKEADNQPAYIQYQKELKTKKKAK